MNSANEINFAISSLNFLENLLLILAFIYFVWSTKDMSKKRVNLFEKLNKLNKPNKSKKEKKQNQKQNQNHEPFKPTCPICLELVYNAMITPCGHTFCEPCFDKIKGEECAMCKTDLEYDSGSPNYLIRQYLDNSVFKDEMTKLKIRALMKCFEPFEVIKNDFNDLHTVFWLEFMKQMEPELNVEKIDRVLAFQEKYENVLDSWFIGLGTVKFHLGQKNMFTFSVKAGEEYYCFNCSKNEFL